MDRREESEKENPFASCLTSFADGCAVIGCLSGVLLFVGIPGALLFVSQWI
ncbi:MULTISPECIES: hypothetical protein [Pontibacillus]|uniref:Uncharacterized protein n=1 Tax=Pontibacillus chungwhensis TaxID=265426 RepID=A0ABY8V3K1_9BACI|nr:MULTISPECIES: hypothetical protein [Pontibacillus]MCD5324530.1 hypothetical protein [Pontibacillus sp. HN14]WIF99174.1 hypothetical protein QNI29_05820 [Pontibacillus chungwhensis]